MLSEYDAYQDGADFYLNEGSALIAVLRYPSKVADGDIEAAQKALEWFNNLMRQWGILIHLHGV